MINLAFNKRAGFDYMILEKFEAGLILAGQEVKSIKAGHISLKESFVIMRNSEFYLINAHIARYKHAEEQKSYDPAGPRKLLLKKSEIKHLSGKIQSRGLTLVPIRVYTKKRLVKLEFGVGKGKKKFDKRADMAKREDKRKIERFLKS
jgi:SsrA-binding protein